MYIYLIYASTLDSFFYLKVTILQSDSINHYELDFMNYECLPFTAVSHTQLTHEDHTLINVYMNVPSGSFYT